MEPHVARALELRYLLTSYLHDRGPLSVAELARLLDVDGFVVWGRPSKVVSDALRWEVRRGRVVRLGRGRYAPGRMPRGTAYRIRKRVEAMHASSIGS